MSMPLRIGVIGVGAMGQHHARIWSTMPGCQFVGVADPSLARAQEIAALYNVAAYTDYQDLLAQVDAVSIAAPTRIHCELGLACVKQHIHMMIEKPLAPSLDEARHLSEAAQDAALVLQVGHIERFNPTFVELAKVLTNLTVLSIDARRLSPAATRAADVSVVYDLMIHDLDLVLNLMDNQPVDVQTMGRKVLALQLDHVVALLTFANGPLVTLTASKVTQHKVRELTVTCAEAFVVADFLNRTVMIHRQSTADYFARQGGVLYRQEGLIEQVYVPPVEPLYAELRHFLACVQEQVTPLVSGTDALRVIALADRIEAGALASLTKHAIES